MIALVASLYNGRFLVGFNELLKLLRPNNSSILDTILLDDASRPVGFGLAGWANSKFKLEKKRQSISSESTKNNQILSVLERRASKIKSVFLREFEKKNKIQESTEKKWVII